MAGYSNPMQNPMLYAGGGAQQQDQYMQMMRAQMMAQQFQQAGEMPNSNEMAGNVAVRHSPLEYLSRTMAQGQAQDQQLKAMQMQMQLMQGMGQQQGAASSAGGVQDHGMQIARAQALYGDVAAKALADDFSRTNDQKNDAMTGGAGSYAGAVTRAQQGNTIGQYTRDGVENVPMTGNQALDLANGGNARAAALNGGIPSASIPTTPPPMPQSVDASQQGSITPALNSLAANPAVIGAPPAIGKSPVYAGQVAATAAGQTEAQKNYQGYLQGINKRVAEGADNTRIMNAQEDLMAHFRPGAGEEELAKAAAAIKTMGGSDNLVNAVARGDKSAVGAVQAFSSMASIHAATQALEIMGGSGGNGQPRIAASVLEEFKNNLSNPNKQEEAIRAINALSRQQYQADFNEQQTAMKDKGDPTTFQGRYAAQINPSLVNGRNISPSDAVMQTEHVAAPQIAPPPMAQRTAGQSYQTPRGMMKWTGTGWMPNAQ